MPIGSPRHGLARAATVTAGLLATAALLAAEARAADTVSFQGALFKHQQGRTQAATEDLEVLARRGDARAQYFLGLAYLRGEGVPLDVARGYGWLLVASKPYDGQFGKGATDDTQQLLQKLEPRLSGRDLIHGEQFAETFRKERDQEFDEARQHAMAVVIADIDAAAAAAGRRSNGGPYPGCALDRGLSGCPKSASLPPDSCRGPIVKPDVAQTLEGGPETRRKLEYPMDARRSAWEGNIPLMLHVARNGEVCRVMIVSSSGVPDLDEAALKAAKRWQATPALREGVPVEVIDVVWVTFMITEYTMK